MCTRESLKTSWIKRCLKMASTGIYLQKNPLRRHFLRWKSNKISQIPIIYAKINQKYCIFSQN